jgi:hypothetical protein
VRRVEESRSRGVEKETASRADARVARDLGTGIARESTRQHAVDPEMVEIWPEPSPSERAAILIALEQMLGTTRCDEVPQPFAWALAGRRESLLGSGVGWRTGWGRGSDQLAGR